jgi:hypothetical protein
MMEYVDPARVSFADMDAPRHSSSWQTTGQGWYCLCFFPVVIILSTYISLWLA